MAPPRRSRSNKEKEEPRLVDDARIDDSDDEEIDEDAAFNSEDELVYGGFFSSSSKKKSACGKSKGRGSGFKSKSNSDDAGDSSGEDDDDDSDVNGSGDSDSGSENNWAGSSDDEEGDDDGGQYMLDLLNNLDKQVTSLDKSNDNGKSDRGSKRGEGGKIALDTPASEAAARLPEGQFQAGALAAMSNNEGGREGGGKLTLDSLMGGISDTAGFASVQRSMRTLSGGTTDKSPAGRKQGESGGGAQRKLETTAVPVSRVVSDRASRKVHYQSMTEDVSQWQAAVHEQRDAEALDFRTNKGGATTNRITRDTLVDKFEASNDFERELQEALENAGMEDEAAMARRERKKLTGEEDDKADEDADEDDLGSNRITLAEYKKRHGELAKLRALMFYEEQKRHRINKIKSKKYRKIRKRQRDRLKDAEEEAAQHDDPHGELERERIEREEMDRMKERMTLAHKNTSKWARRVLRRGAKMDIEERRALSLQIAKGEELRRKVMGEDGEDDASSGEEGETEGILLKKARDILMENDEDNYEDGEEGSEKKGKKGLFQLEFMKRGMEAQRRRAKEEARKLIEELEANELATMSSDSEEDKDAKEEKEEESRIKKPKRAVSEAETKHLLPEGKLVASSLKFGKADGFAIKVDGNIELDKKTNKNKGAQVNGTESGKGSRKKKSKRKKNGQNQVVGNTDTVAGKSSSIQAKNAAATAATLKLAPEEKDQEEENPWIVSKSNAKKEANSKPLPKTVNINEAASMLVDAARNHKNSPKRRKQGDDSQASKTKEQQQDPNIAKDKDTPMAPTKATDDKVDVGIANLSQAELVQRAFAAPADLEVEEEFQKEKEQMKERDDPTRKKMEDTFVSGWGSWAGAGAPPPRKARKLPQKMQPPSKKAESNAIKRKDDGMSTVIINEKRIKKTATKFQLSEIPYPYRSREEYERSVAGNIGQEWNTILGSKEMSRPAVLVRAGKIIQPISKKAKMAKGAGKKMSMSRAPAKF